MLTCCHVPYDIVISLHGATTWTILYSIIGIHVHRSFSFRSTLLLLWFCLYLHFHSSVVLNAYAYVRPTLVEFWRRTIDYVYTVQQQYNRCGRRNGTQPDDNDRHRCHRRRSGPVGGRHSAVVTRQSVGWCRMFLCVSFSAVHAQHTARVFVCTTTTNNSLLLTHSNTNSLYSLCRLSSRFFFATVHSWIPTVRVFPFC